MTLYPPRALLMAGIVAATACSGGSGDDTTDSPGPSTDDGSTIVTTADTGPTTTGETEGCSETVEVDVGVGDFVYAPLEDPSDGVLVVYGSQGGWHIDVAGAVSGTGQEVAVAAPLIRVVEDDIQIAGGNQEPTYLPLTGYDLASCTGTFAGARAFVDDHLPDVPYDEFVCGLEGKQVEIELTVSDLNDMEVTGTSTGSGTIVLDEAFKQKACR